MEQPTNTPTQAIATIRALLAAGWRPDSIHTAGVSDTVRTMLHPSGREIEARTNRYDNDTTLTLTGLDLDQVTGAITGAGLAAPVAEKADAASLPAALRRLADQIEHNDLPVPIFRLRVGGVVRTRAEVERWAEHLGVAITMGGTQHNIPVAEIDVPTTDDGPVMEISFQGPAESVTPEVVQLRAEVEQLRAQLAGGAR